MARKPFKISVSRGRRPPVRRQAAINLDHDILILVVKVRHTDEVRSSSRAIREWQAQVIKHSKEVRSQHPPRTQLTPSVILAGLQADDIKLITGVLYPVASARPRPIRLGVVYHADDDARATGLVDDVRLKHWFPGGCTYTRVHVVPGSDLTLANDYTIVTGAEPRRSLMNKATSNHLRCEARGNIIVLRHHQRYQMSATNVHSAERKLIDFVVHQ